MKSTAKKQTVYYHITQFGNAANILKTGKMQGGIIADIERSSHRAAGISERGYYISLARSLSSSYIASSFRGGTRDNIFCVLMIDTSKIRSRFKLAPISFANTERDSSEYEERLISDTEYIDVSNAVVGLVFRATEVDGKNIVKIPRRFFPYTKGRKLFYVTRRNVEAKRPLTLKLELSKTPLSEVTSLPPNKVGIYKFPTLVLRTPINKVPMLPITQLALYVWHCLHMHEKQSGAYENKSVYDYINSLAVRRKVKPEVIMNEMYEAGVAALERREGRVLKDFIAQVALATQNTRTRGERRKSLGYMRDAAAALWYIFPHIEFSNPDLAKDFKSLRNALAFASVSAYSVEDFVLAHAKYDPSDWYGMDWDGYVGVKLDALLDEITSNVGKELASKLAPHFTAMYYNNNARAMQVLRDKAT